MVSNEALSVPPSSTSAVETALDPAAYSQAESECTETADGSRQSDGADLGVPEPAEAMLHRENVVLSEPASSSLPRARAEPEGGDQVQLRPQSRAQPEPKVSSSPCPTASCSVSTESAFPALPGSGGGICRSKAVRARVSRNVAVRSTYKYGGDGFGIWNRPRRKPRRSETATELYCTKRFSGKLSATEYVGKLKRYLVAKGGFDAKSIKSARAFLVKSQDGAVWNAKVFVEAPRENIEVAIERIDAKRRASGKSSAVRISGLRRNQRSNRLMVKNFYILTKNDHRKFTELFTAFRPLRCDHRHIRERLKSDELKWNGRSANEQILNLQNATAGSYSRRGRGRTERRCRGPISLKQRNRLSRNQQSRKHRKRQYHRW